MNKVFFYSFIILDRFRVIELVVLLFWACKIPLIKQYLWRGVYAQLRTLSDCTLAGVASSRMADHLRFFSNNQKSIINKYYEVKIFMQQWKTRIFIKKCLWTQHAYYFVWFMQEIQYDCIRLLYWLKLVKKYFFYTML